jgi:methylase of polypeptide subunit release factors
MLSALLADSLAYPAVTPRALPVPPLALLLSELAASNYSFITPTPLTHQRVVAHRAHKAQWSTAAVNSCQPTTTLRDIFGWNLQFEAAAVRHDLLALMEDTGILRCHGDSFSSAVRVSCIDDDLFVHSAYPTTQDNAVFFGPDTYRFARFIQQSIELTHSWRVGAGRACGRPLRVLDVGCGSGAGGVVAARCLKNLDIPFSVVMNDINPLALHYTAVNAAFAGMPVELAEGDALSAVTGMFDLVISNPPYLDDAAARSYRHGGARLGRALSVRIAAEALGRLAPGGQLLLYTGVAMVDGVDPFMAEMLPLLAQTDCDWSYTEIDPDVFGEELEQPVYAHVDRIAAVGLVVTRHRAAS